ncbi:MAG: hypothetical protein DRO01_04175 [Thermoproteota archaeon]|nr:MAG: hypothetical protein DRO01_04175 [Candidatus Korarchaeota archaeon]
MPEHNRRETWGETVNRYVDNIISPHTVKDESEAIRKDITDMRVMPSMRSMMTAGKAAERDNTCMYNCAYVAVDDPKAFDEAMFILLCGTGVGFSVERQNVQKLPEIPDLLFDSETTIVVKDSKEGWAKAFRQLLSLLWAGEIPQWDVSKVRPAGAKLKTFGGRASGPVPLVDLFLFTIATFKTAVGRKLTSIECHDIMCKVGEIVVVGGVRRSAMISLSNLSDDRMRHAKSGQWWSTAPHRALSNNSVCYTEKPDMESFMREWLALMESKSGERGIFNRQAAVNQAGKNGRRNVDHEFGVNPCCFTGDMTLLTDDGYKRFDELTKLDAVNIVNSDGEVTSGKVWSSGVKPIVSVNFESRLGKRSICVTADHVFKLADGTEVMAGDLSGKRLKFYDGDVRGLKVRSVTKSGDAEVFDFTEPKTHWGVVNGVVVHNSEIILRPSQFCNLSEVVCRKSDTLEQLSAKVRTATIIGTIQSTYTHFPYLRKIWQKNTAEERLLGVSLTGIMDCDLLNSTDGLDETLSYLKSVAVDTNKEWADKLGIEVSTAITTVKPSGTVSQLTDTSSGIHSRHSEYYIRTVRGDNKDPMTQFMIAQGISNEPDVTKPDTTTVFSFAQKSPEGAITRSDMAAVEQLEFWLAYQRHWCEHKPSVTVSVKDCEWMEVGAWVYAHFDEVSGISFLPYTDHVYKQAPYQEISAREYDDMLSFATNVIDWSGLAEFEIEDTTKGSQTLACSAGGMCELVDL